MRAMPGTGFEVYHFIFLTLVGGSTAYGAYDFRDLNNLGDEITRNVNAQLAPLQNLGSRISEHVHQQLKPLQNLPNLYNNVYNRQFSGFQPPLTVPNKPFAGPDLSGLDNLGEHIQQSVYEGLEPVRALEVTARMKNGVGGTTIATYLPEGKKFIIVNNNVQECSGSVSEDGKCSGSLSPFRVNNKKDYCYNRQGLSIVNDQVCIGASSISVVNNEIRCVSNSGTPALLIPYDEFRKLCEGISKTVEYKYIANPQDPSHVEIPNGNKYVKCSNNQPGMCVFTETNVFPNGNGNIFINTGSIGR